MTRSIWRFFPIALIGGLGLTIAANAVMIYAALASFPGKSNDEGFALSNHYDEVLARAERDASLGWTMAVSADAQGRAVVMLTDRRGTPLDRATITGVAERPLGERDRLALAFHETDSGRYVADVVLPAPGQWELTLSASTADLALAATRRVVVR